MKCTPVVAVFHLAVLLAIVPNSVNGHGAGRPGALVVSFSSQTTSRFGSSDEPTGGETSEQHLELVLTAKDTKADEPEEWEVRFQRLALKLASRSETILEFSAKRRIIPEGSADFFKRLENATIHAVRKPDGALGIKEYPKVLKENFPEIGIEAQSTLRALLLESQIEHLLQYAAYTLPTDASKGSVMRKAYAMPVGPLGTIEAGVEYKIEEIDQKQAKTSILPYFNYKAPMEQKRRGFLKVITGELKLRESTGLLVFDRSANRVKTLDLSYLVEGNWTVVVNERQQSLAVSQRYRINVK